MRVCETSDEYRACPCGAYLPSPSGMVFCVRPDLWGFALWGRPTPAEVAWMLPLVDLQLAAGVPRHAVLIDARYLQDAEQGSVALLARFLQERAAPIEARVSRASVARPGGVLGMLIAGFAEVIGVRCPVRSFEEFAAAADWVGAGDCLGALEAACEDAYFASTGLAQLREWLDAHVDGATLERAARAVGRSPRSLQRDLGRARSSFQRELLAARVRCAQRLLAGTDRSLGEIAEDVGCASPQHFSNLFRRLIGMTPSGWRTLHRAR